MPDNKIGLEAVFENEDFQRGVNDYNSAVDDADAKTASAGGRMSEVWNGLAGAGQVAFNAIAVGVTATAAIVAAAVATITGLVFNAADAAGQLVDLSAKTGISVTTLQELQYVGDQVGVSLDTITGAQARLVRSMASGNKAFNTLGISVKDSNGELRDQEEVFNEVIDALGGVENPAERDALAMELFGRSAQELNPLIKAGSQGLKDLAEQAHDVGAVMSEDAVFALESFGDTMASVKAGFKGVLGTLAAQAVPAFQKFATVLQDLFTSETFQKRVQEIGAVIGKIAQIVADAIGGIADSLEAFPDDPLGFLADIFYKIGFNLEKVFGIKGANNFFSNFADGFLKIADAVKEFYNNTLLPFLKSNAQEIIVGILAAIGVALVAFASTAISAAISAAAAFAPIIITMGIIGGAAALLFKAWKEDWGGIQEKTAELWAVVQPIFEDLIQWLQTNIPIALQFLSDFWTNVLLPAIEVVFSWIVANLFPLLISLIEWLQVNVPIALQFLADVWANVLQPAIEAVWNWISTTLLPLLASLIEWLSVNIPLAISTLSAFWTTTLLPALQAVWSWISTNLIPLFQAIADLFNTVLTLAITALAGLWQNILFPAIQKVGNWISANLLPIFRSIGKTINDDVMPALEPFADFIGNVLQAAFDGITQSVQILTGWIESLTEAFNKIELPPALTPGSPTPFELGLKGINEQLKKLAGASLPAITQEMKVLAQVRDVPGANGTAAASRVINNSNSVNNYLFGASFNVNNSNGLFEILAGLS